MDALKEELYAIATTTLGPQQQQLPKMFQVLFEDPTQQPQVLQQMPSRPPRPLGDQAWALLLELGDLYGRQMLQKPLRLPP